MLIVPKYALAALLALSVLPVQAEGPAPVPTHPFLPIPRFGATGQAELPPNTMLEPVPREMKRQWAQLFMMLSPIGVRDLLNVMAHKVPAKPGVTIDQAAAALIARAEKHGFLLVDRYRMWKELQARTGEVDPYKVEVISICDPLISRDWLDYAPEMALFVPPRIALVEDRERRLWLIMLDWDMHWIDTARHAGFDPGLRAQGIERREMLEDILRAAANGEN